ncbi:MAG: N(4)-(beta-N-acetylglucosaminyl)-L-asparaginase [Phycisphaeraceae bacterium]|nr:N(4)-(beta-N-acetylglucosaminyl)-L-asparaginase [Phycisphaeraceae bacterium]MCW5763615.1 N(4)-(beta-N-acetylglucosaminyl)-L-asparaginase [Phycisphaeraceae bacterium]
MNDRREFLAMMSAAAFGGIAGSASGGAAGSSSRGPGDEHRGPCVIASANGLRNNDTGCVVTAMNAVRRGLDPVDAVVAGVKLVEDDPDDHSVGLGGLPNEDGIVQLDASVMHGPTHKAGAVAALENIRYASEVALHVLKRTDHILLVGEGAKKFALRMGYKEENLLTDKARKIWLQWKANMSREDDWLNDDEMDFPPPAHSRIDPTQPFTYGTINCSAVNDQGTLASCTTTSGLSYKIPGRVGDSPIVGAGMYVDNEIGAAGATGRGEAAIANCTAYEIVRSMSQGMTPTEACLHAVRRMADRTLEKRLRNDKGQPNFNVIVYALRKDGAYGSASIHPGARFAVYDSTGPKHVNAASLL